MHLETFRNMVMGKKKLLFIYNSVQTFTFAFTVWNTVDHLSPLISQSLIKRQNIVVISFQIPQPKIFNRDIITQVWNLHVFFLSGCILTWWPAPRMQWWGGHLLSTQRLHSARICCSTYPVTKKVTHYSTLIFSPGTEYKKGTHIQV